MARFLRLISFNKWIEAEAAPFLTLGDVPADSVTDLRTTQNKLSVWQVDDDPSVVTRVVCALAASRSRIDHAHYVVFGSELLAEAGVRFSQTPGVCKDAGIVDRHYDITLSGTSLVKLVRLMYERGTISRVIKPDLRVLVEQAIHQGQLRGVDPSWFK